MSKKEDNNLFTNQKIESPKVEVREKYNESDNLSKMINASRAFRNLPPEFIMDNSDLRGGE